MAPPTMDCGERTGPGRSAGERSVFSFMCRSPSDADAGRCGSFPTCAEAGAADQAVAAGGSAGSVRRCGDLPSGDDRRTRRALPAVSRLSLLRRRHCVDDDPRAGPAATARRCSCCTATRRPTHVAPGRAPPRDPAHRGLRRPARLRRLAAAAERRRRTRLLEARHGRRPGADHGARSATSASRWSAHDRGGAGGPPAGLDHAERVSASPRSTSRPRWGCTRPPTATSPTPTGTGSS